MNWSKLKNKKTLIKLFAAAILLLAAALVVPALINLDSYALLLADGLTDALGSRVVIESGRPAILPHVSFVVSGVEIPDGIGPLQKLTAPRARIDLDVFSLLFGKILVKKVHFRSPRVWLSLRGSDEPSAGSDNENPLGFLHSSDMLPEQLDVSIRNGFITVLDRVSASSATIETELCDVNIQVKGISPDRPFEVRSSCSVPCDGDKGKIEAQFQIDPSAISSGERVLPFKLSGSVSAQRIDCSLFEAYLPPVMREAGVSGRCSLNLAVEAQDPERISLEGEANVERLSLKNSFSRQPKSKTHDVRISFQALASSVSFVARAITAAIDADRFECQLSVEKPGASEATIAFEAGGSKVPIAAVLDLLPAPLLPPEAHERIHSMDISGELRQPMVAFAGSVSDFHDNSSLAPRRLFAHSLFREASVHPAFERLGLQRLGGSASLENGLVTIGVSEGYVTSPSADQPLCVIDDATVHLGLLGDLKKKADEWDSLKLTDNRDSSRESEPMVTVSAHAHWPFMAVPSLCAAVPSLSAASPVLSDLDQLEGKVQGTCDLTLFLTEPYDPDYEARLSISDGAARYRPLDLELPLHRLAANLSPESARVDVLLPLQGHYSITAAAEIDDPFMDSASLSAEATVGTEPPLLLALLGQSDDDSELRCTGPTIVTSMNATGNYDKLNVSLNADLTEHEFSYGDWFRKEAGQNCSLRASATTAGLEGVSIDEAQLDIGPVTLRGSGRFVRADIPQWELSAYLGETDVSDLARFGPTVSNLGLKAKLTAWLRLLPQGRESEGLAPDGSKGTPALCQVGLVATLDADAINKVLAADVMSESLRRAFGQTDFTSGQAKVEATVEFPLWNLTEAEFDAVAELQDLGLKRSDLPLELSGLSGKVELGSHALRIRSLTGALGQSSFELEAEVGEPLLGAFQEARWKTTKVNMRLSLRPSLADVKAALGPSFPEGLSYSQAPKVELKAQGDPDDLTFDVRVWPRGDTLSWGKVCLNPDRANPNILLRGRLQELARLSAVKGEIAVGESKLEFAGQASDLTKPELDFRIAKRSIRMADISALFSILDPNLASGELVLSMDAELGPQLPTGRRVQSRLIARGVSFGLSGAERRIEDLSFSLDASPSVISVDGFSVKVGQSKVSLDGRADFDAKDLRLNVKSPNFDTDDFVKALSSKEPADRQSSATASPAIASPAIAAPLGDLTWLGEQPFFAHGTVDASVNVEKLKVGKHDLGRIDLALPIRDGVLRVEGFETNFCHGDLSVNLAARRLLPCGLSLETDFKLRDVKLEEVLELAGTEKVLATGKARISGSLDVCGSDADELLNFAKGQFKLKSRDGVIKKFGILSKIFSLLDILRVFKMDFKDFTTTGTSYELLECTATLDDGVLSTRDFVLTGSSMKMTAICDMDLMSQTVEATVGVFLMPTMGSLTNKIPFVGPIITQGNKTLLPTYFRVRGSISDPTVESLQLNLIKSGTIDALRKLLSVSDSTRP